MARASRRVLLHGLALSAGWAVAVGYGVIRPSGGRDGVATAAPPHLAREVPGRDVEQISGPPGEDPSSEACSGSRLEALDLEVRARRADLLTTWGRPPPASTLPDPSEDDVHGLFDEPGSAVQVRCDPPPCRAILFAEPAEMEHVRDRLAAIGFPDADVNLPSQGQRGLVEIAFVDRPLEPQERKFLAVLRQLDRSDFVIRESEAEQAEEAEP